MATFCSTHTPFLQSRAKLLILPVSRDGTTLNPILQRLQSLYPCNYQAYRQKLDNGDLRLGDVFLHKLQNQVTGLGISSHHQPSHIANLITTHHAKHPTQISTFTKTCTHLKPHLFDLMRHHGIYHVAMLATPMLTAVPSDDTPHSPTAISAYAIWQVCQKVLDIPRIQLDIHFARDTVIDF